MTSRVYLYILTSPSGKQYVGQAVNTHVRFSKYRRLACMQQTALHAALSKYGWDAFSVEVLGHVPAADADRYETYLIADLGTQAPGGYNVMAGGQSGGRGKCRKGHDLDVAGRTTAQNCRLCHNARQAAQRKAKYAADPVYADRMKARARARRERANELQRLRYASDPAYAEHKRALSRARHHKMSRVVQ
jgi:group I intron endonuclease